MDYPDYAIIKLEDVLDEKNTGNIDIGKSIDISRKHLARFLRGACAGNRLNTGCRHHRADMAGGAAGAKPDRPA